MSSNPYAGYSTLAHPPRFVGRARAIRHMGPAIRGSGSRAIVGMPRIGKSSLALVARLQAQEAGEGTVGWIDVGGVGDTITLLEAILRLLDETEDDPDRSAISLKQHLLRRRRAGERLFVILDEFDAVRITRDASLSVRRLRELLIDPMTYGLTCLLVCRRELGIIEDSVPELSNLANACPSFALRMFDEDELVEMAERGFPPALARNLAAQVGTLTSGVPVLAEEAFFHLFDGATLVDVAEFIQPSARSVVASWTQLLQDLGLWAAFVDYTTGCGAKSGLELERLVDYGVLVPAGHAYVSGFRALSGFATLCPPEQPWATDG